MVRRQIALLTDFGTRDHYVAAMKGVIAGRCEAAIHDLTHDIEPYDVFAAAWYLRNCEAYWPAGTIFVCVVDPGVGTSRRIVAIERGGHIFLAPDNGLLTFVDEGAQARVEVTDETLFLPAGSNTFHGRDRLAPVAAALASGTSVASTGRPIESILQLRYRPPLYRDDVCAGTVVAIDRFGNAVTDLEAARIPFQRPVGKVGEAGIDRLERTYGEASPGPFFIAGSSGLLEISVANGSAAKLLGITRFTAVEIWPA